MRSSTSFLSLFICVIISFVNSQSNVKTKNKLSFLSNHLVKSRVKGDPKNLGIVDSVNLPPEPSDVQMFSTQEEFFQQLSVVFKEANYYQGDLRNQIKDVAKELAELKRSKLAKSAILTNPYLYSRYYDAYYKAEGIKADVNWTFSEPPKPVNFTIKAYPFKAEARAALKNQTYYVSLAFRRLDESVERGDARLNLTLIPAVYYTVKDYQKNDVVRVTNFNFGQVLQYDVFSYEKPIIRLEKIYNTTAFYISIYVEPPAVTAYGYSYDGVLSWVIEEYRKKRDWEVKDIVEYQVSPYFYTSPRGYRVQVRMRLSGYGEYQQGLTAQIHFLTGPYDEELSSNFKHRTIVTFFHPTDPSHHMVISMDTNKTAVPYNIPMGLHEDMEKLLDGNGNLYYQVRILPDTGENVKFEY